MVNCCGQDKYKDGQTRNDRRQQLLDEIKSMIGDLDNREQERGRPKKQSGEGVAGIRDMDEECKQYRRRRDCTPPLITSLAIHETRPTSDYTNKQHENTSQWTYKDATRQDMFDPMPPAPWELPRTPSQELRAGTLYQNCDCRRRNGLQHDCPRWDCGGRPTCLAVNPGPCCEPSKARKPVRGDRRYTPASGGVQRELQQQQPTQQQQQASPGKMVCLCTPMPLGRGEKRPGAPAGNSQPCPKNKPVAQDLVGFLAIGAMGPIGFVAVPPLQASHGMSGSPAGTGTEPQGAPGAKYLCCPAS